MDFRKFRKLRKFPGGIILKNPSPEGQAVQRKLLKRQEANFNLISPEAQRKTCKNWFCSSVECEMYPFELRNTFKLLPHA